jgi:hypothetical protein
MCQDADAEVAVPPDMMGEETVSVVESDGSERQRIHGKIQKIPSISRTSKRL